MSPDKGTLLSIDSIVCSETLHFDGGLPLGVAWWRMEEPWRGVRNLEHQNSGPTNCWVLAVICRRSNRKEQNQSGRIAYHATQFNINYKINYKMKSPFGKLFLHRQLRMGRVCLVLLPQKDQALPYQAWGQIERNQIVISKQLQKHNNLSTIDWKYLGWS